MEAYKKLKESLDALPCIRDSFDIQCRSFRTVFGREISFYSVAGLLDTDLAEKIIDFVARDEAGGAIYRIPHHDVSYSDKCDALAEALLSGRGVILASGEREGAIVDLKSYPLRAVGEPENDRVLRGPRDGFGEALVRNTSLIRRRLKDPNLVIKLIRIGERAGCDVALCYVKGTADPDFSEKMEKKLRGIRINALNMSQESLAECLIKRGWYNPFPKIRYTERPDAASAMLEEGSVIILCDNSPQAMILPTSIFDFLQESDDFYFPPLVGSYLRITRMMIFALSLFLTPLWLLLLKTPESLPPWLSFIDINERAAVPLFLQLLLAEFMIDGLKLASLNTPNMLGNSLSVVGGLILGDYAVEAGWFSPQTILYMAIVAIASFTQQSYELGYAFKFLRILLLLLVELFGGYGFAVGIVISVLAVALNRTVDGSRSYLYPLIPFNARAMGRLLFRPKLKYEGKRRGHDDT